MSSSVEDQATVAAYGTPHMAWTEENTLNVPRVCLTSVMERKEEHRKVVKMSRLHSEKRGRLAPKRRSEWS